MKKDFNKRVKHLVHIALFSAIGFVFMVLETSVSIVPAFLKFDISELPALLVTFMYGPISGVLVCLTKNVLHLTFTSTSGVGELSNFILGAVFCIVVGLIYKRFRTKKGALVSMFIGSAFTGLVCFLTNLYLVYPLFYRFVVPKEAILSMCQAVLPWIDSIEKSLLVFNVPFTFAKCCICSVITFVVYKRLKKVLKIENASV